MASTELNREQLVRDAQVVIQFENDTHRAALEDDPEHVKVSLGTWVSIISMAMSFGSTLGLAFITVGSVVYPVSLALGDPDNVAWIIGAHALAQAVSVALAGFLSDIFGRRYPILAGQSLVLIGSILGATAPKMGALIAAEAFVGLGSGFIFVSYPAVTEMLPNKWRAFGLGILEGGTGIPWASVGVLLGNVLLQYLTWRWIFYFAIIFQVISLVGTALAYWPRPRPRGDYDKTRWQEVKEIDFIGAFLFTAGLTSFLVGLTWADSGKRTWWSASVIAPMVIGLAILLVALIYEAKFATNPVVPWSLLTKFRQYSALLVVMFVSAMTFYPMVSLLPQAYQFLFTTDAVHVGVYALPNNIMTTITSIGGSMMAFIAATAGVLDPNNKFGMIFLPTFGVPMYPWIIVLTTTIVSLHVPHSALGLAVGLLGSIRGAGGAVGNAMLHTIVQSRFSSYAGPEIAAAALENGLSLQYLPEIISGAINYNRGLPHAFDGIPGITPAIEESLRTAVRSAWGHAFKIACLITIPFGAISIIAALCVEDVSKYMTNHTQFVMSKNLTTHEADLDRIVHKREQDSTHVETVSTTLEEVQPGKQG